MKFDQAIQPLIDSLGDRDVDNEFWTQVQTLAECASSGRPATLVLNFADRKEPIELYGQVGDHIEITPELRERSRADLSSSVRR